MENMIISDDNDNKKSYCLTKWDKTVTKDSIDIDLFTSSETISYSISADMRERNIKEITDFVTAEIAGALRGERILYISELLRTVTFD